MSMHDGNPESPAPSWPRPFDGPIVYVDIETTGLSRSKHRMIELGAWHMDESVPQVFLFHLSDYDKVKVRDDDEYFHSQGRKSASDVTGLWERIGDFESARTVAEQAQDVGNALCPRKKLGERKQGMLVGHNVVQFDAPFIDDELRAAGLHGWSGKPFLDTMIMARCLFTRHKQKRFSLDACRDFVGLPPEGVHTAEGGVRACREYVERVGDLAVLGKYVMNKTGANNYREACEIVRDLVNNAKAE